MTFTFTICISRRFSSVPNGDYPEILIAKCNEPTVQFSAHLVEKDVAL
jgi:hypothetical protein